MRKKSFPQSSAINDIIVLEVNNFSKVNDLVIKNINFENYRILLNNYAHF